MIPFSEALWEGEAEAIINEMSAKNAVTNQSYFYDTVDLIEAGLSPIRQGQVLTRSDLAEWKQRCTAPQETAEETHNAQRITTPTHRTA